MSDFQEQKEVLTTGEVAKICNVAARTVSKWFDKGDIEGYRIPGSKDRRIPKSSLIKFMKQHGIPLDGLMTGTTRVLVVESDVATRDTLLKVLGDNTGYELRGCENTFVAGIECERFAPHVVLLDTSLPGVALKLFRPCKPTKTGQLTSLRSVAAPPIPATRRISARVTPVAFGSHSPFVR